jgi:hypothetical protein
MSGEQFSWLDEDGTLLAGEPGSEPAQRGRRRLYMALAMLPLILLVAGLGYRRLERETAPLVEQEVARSYALLHGAVLQGDANLIGQYLDDSRPAWAEAQLQIFGEQGRRALAAYGLTRQSRFIPPTRIEMAPDQQSALILAGQVYSRTNAAGEAHTFWLEQTLHVRWDGARWLLTAPPGDYWGEQRLAARSRLRLTYRARDAELAERLAGDLSGWLERLCTQLPEISCPADFNVQLRLGTNTGALLDPVGAALFGGAFVLPTPSLLGLPVGGDSGELEGAYMALAEGYARLVVGRALAQLAGLPCCDGQLFFEALVEGQRAALGLPARALQPIDFRRAGRDKLRPSQLTGLWMRDPADATERNMRRALLLVGFLQQVDSGVSLFALQSRLAAAGSFAEWAGQPAAENWSFRHSALWQGYISSNSGSFDGEEFALPVEFGGN